MAAFKGSPGYSAIQSLAKRSTPATPFGDIYGPQRAQEEAMAQTQAAQTAARIPVAQAGMAEADTAFRGTEVAANTAGRASDYGFGGNLRQPAYETQAQTALEAKLQSDATAAEAARRATAGEADWTRRLSAIRSLSGGRSTGEPSDANIVADEQKARDAAFARAKDQQGQIARSALNSLSSVMSERGLLGGGYEGRGVADIVGGAQTSLGETSRDIAMADVDRAAQIADRNYGGALTRRGQDLSKFQSLLGILSSARAY